MARRKHRGTYSYTAVVAADRRTKQLCHRLHPHQIALIDHTDVDEMAARSLLEAGVQVVINSSPFMTGQYPAAGGRTLLEAGAVLFEIREDASPIALLERMDGQYVTIQGEKLYVFEQEEWVYVTDLYPVTFEMIQEKEEDASARLNTTLSSFIDNTLHYANREKDLFLNPLPSLHLTTPIANRHVVVVVRGKHYQEDLRMLAPYIKECRPVLIGVDGGADALLRSGYVPDVIVGDMDSVSDKALQCGAEVVVHAFSDGHAPGSQRLDRLGVAYQLLPAPGTSEDVAMLLAFDKQAELIVTIGSHTNMIDFLEKGRKGMGSTLLVRTKIGTRLIDAKGVSQLYHSRSSWRLWGWCLAAMLAPITAALAVNPVARHVAHMMWMQWRNWAF